jgi:hypothetical protein
MSVVRESGPAPAAPAHTGEVATEATASAAGPRYRDSGPIPPLAAASGGGHGPSASERAYDGALSGTMLVSNNPEGLSSPGTIVSARAKAGTLAVYVHHSNHTRAPLDIVLVVTPAGGQPLHITLTGAAATTGDGQRAHGGPDAWASDPNVVVETANEARAGDPDGKHRTSSAKTAHGPTPFRLGTIAALGHGDPPLFDARYDLTLSGDAEVAVIAEPRGGEQAATHEHRLATGNTKYEESGSNGRAAGLYHGATFRERDALTVSKLPHHVPLTGSKFSSNHVKSPELEPGGASEVTPLTPAAIAAVRDKLGSSVDDAAVVVLERVFRISPDWLRERGAWNGSHLTSAGLTADYAQLIGEVRTAIAADRQDAALTHTQAVIARHHAIGARLDAASYGTKFELGFDIANDTASAAKVGMTFLTDAGAARNHAPGAVYRGAVYVDGTEHRINSDTASGHPASTDLGVAADVAPGASRHVDVQLESPGQVSGGQELDIEKR